MKYERMRIGARIVIWVLLALALGLWAAAEGDPGGLEVYFFDLGRVDGMLIRCDGETGFIDVGFESDAKLAIRYLKALGIDHLNCYIGTHGHEDHIDGAPEMIEALAPDRIYVSHIGCLSAILDCSTEAQKQAVAASERIILQAGDVFNIGGAKLTCLGPLTLRNCYTGSYHENENSLILRLDYGSRSILFTGDTTDGILREVDQQFPGMLKVDVLKNPHHNGTHDEDVIRLIAPELAVFCTGEHDMPAKAYISMLNALGVRSYITGPAGNGHVILLSDGEKWTVRCGYAVNGATLQPVPDLYVGEEYPLACAIDGDAGLSPERHLAYSSSDEGVALAYNGRVWGVAPGTATVTATSINGVTASTEVRVYAARVALDRSELKLAVGETARLEANIEPVGAGGLAVEWLSDNESVVRVSEGGVEAVGEGEARVIARLTNGSESACAVTVRGMIARAVRLDQRKVTLKVGDNLTLYASVQPAGYNPDDLDWQSSDEDVLWVDGYGNVTAVRKGRAKITVTASEGVYDVCEIKVK